MDLCDSIRKEFKEIDDKRDAGLSTPADIMRFDDIVYGNDAVWQCLDVYRPENLRNEKLPVIVSFHGGGWVYGDKQCYQYYCMSLSLMGFAVVNFSHRLAPEHRFPVSMIDFNLVLKWMSDNADAYGFDMDNLFAVGDSVGAHCLAMYANILTNRNYAEAFSCYAYADTDKERFNSIDDEGFHVPAGIRFRAIALNCGIYKIDTDGSDVLSQLASLYLPDAEDDMVDIVRYITSDYPPVFMMTANDDYLKDEVFPLFESLVANGIDCLVRHCAYDGNAFSHVFHCDVNSGYALRLNKEELSFFRDYIM